MQREKAFRAFDLAHRYPNLVPVPRHAQAELKPFVRPMPGKAPLDSLLARIAGVQGYEPNNEERKEFMNEFKKLVDGENRLKNHPDFGKGKNPTDIHTSPAFRAAHTPTTLGRFEGKKPTGGPRHERVVRALEKKGDLKRWTRLRDYLQMYEKFTQAEVPAKMLMLGKSASKEEKVLLKQQDIMEQGTGQSTSAGGALVHKAIKSCCKNLPLNPK